MLADEDERDRLVKNMLLAFSQRYVDIFRHSQNWRGEDMTELSKLYSNLERKLFTAEYISCTDLEKWKDCPLARLVASDLARLDEPPPLAIGMSHTPDNDAAEPNNKRLKH